MCQCVLSAGRRCVRTTCSWYNWHLRCERWAWKAVQTIFNGRSKGINIGINPGHMGILIYWVTCHACSAEKTQHIEWCVMQCPENSTHWVMCDTELKKSTPWVECHCACQHIGCECHQIECQHIWVRVTWL